MIKRHLLTLGLSQVFHNLTLFKQENFMQSITTYAWAVGGIFLGAWAYAYYTSTQG